MNFKITMNDGTVKQYDKEAFEDRLCFMDNIKFWLKVKSVERVDKVAAPKPEHVFSKREFAQGVKITKEFLAEWIEENGDSEAMTCFNEDDEPHAYSFVKYALKDYLGRWPTRREMAASGATPDDVTKERWKELDADEAYTFGFSEEQKRRGAF